jgi:hypothetical protein
VTDPKLTAGLAWLQALAEQRDEAQEIPAPEILERLLDAASQRPFPSALDSDLTEILGIPCFRASAMVLLFRATGTAVPRQAEAEQAFVLHWLLGLWIQHGAGWRIAAGEFLGNLNFKLKGAA